MNEALLPIFQQAYRDLDLFPLIEPKDIESFRVDYGREVLVRLRQEVNASVKDQKLLPALVQVYETLNNEETDSDAFVKLLHGLMVLEYQNDALWYDVHPIVVDLLRQKALIQ